MFAVVVADLAPLKPFNAFFKYADDMYLIVSARDSCSCVDELTHIANWAARNNLKLNSSKSKEIVFYKSQRHLNSAPHPPSITGIEQVSVIKVLGVTLSADFTMTKHIDTTLTSCAQSLFALKTLRAHGMPYHSICDVYRATTLAKIVYASPAWWGFTSAADGLRLEAFIAKSRKMKLYAENGPNFDALCKMADDAFFHKVISNPGHTLFHLLPPPTAHTYGLRPRRHNLQLSSVSSALYRQNFLPRLLLKDCY
jgi:hypothetical protein